MSAGWTGEAAGAKGEGRSLGICSPPLFALSGTLDTSFRYSQRLWTACGMHTLRDGFMATRLGPLDLNPGVLFKGLAPSDRPRALLAVFHTHPPAPTRPFDPAWARPNPREAPPYK